MSRWQRSMRRPIALLLAFAVISLPALLPAQATAQAPARRATARMAPPLDRPEPLDDIMFRPTVLVRKGSSRGSGTIIASATGRSLVLTAAHVIDGPGEAAIELHRFNLGIEGRNLGGPWPKVVPAKIVATDPEADVAVLLVEGRARLPYVARLDEALSQPPKGGAPVTSVGIDHASDLNSWNSKIRGTALLSRNVATHAGTGRPAEEARAGPDRSQANRLFLITEHPPVEGRSGGGLYSEDGRLLGVCVGRIEIKNRQGETNAIGLFASGESIRRVLDRLDPQASSN